MNSNRTAIDGSVGVSMELKFAPLESSLHSARQELRNAQKESSDLDSECKRWKGEVANLKCLLDSQAVHEDALLATKEAHLQCQTQLVNCQHREAELTEALESRASALPVNPAHARVFNNVIQKRILMMKADAIQEVSSNARDFASDDNDDK